MTITAPSIVNRELFNAALLAMAAPHIVGTLDYENKAGYQAHDRYTHDGDIAEYTQGYLDTAKAHGRADSAKGCYNPPSPHFAPAYDAYVRAHNDTWAARINRTSWFMAR